MLAEAIRPWSPPLKRFLARIACNSLVGRAIAAHYRDRIPSGDLVVDTSNPAITPEMKAAIFWGLYESAEQRFIRQYLRRDLDVVELGSSLGLVSSLIARTVDRTRQVICVEANPRLHETLRRNLRLNVPDREVAIVPEAVAYSTDGARFVTGADNTVGRVDPNGGTGDPVPTTTVSRLLRQHRVGPFALVCDIEGMEADVISRDAIALDQCQQIIIELHDRADGTATVERLVTALQVDLGFTLRQRYGPVCVFDRGAPADHRR